MNEHRRYVLIACAAVVVIGMIGFWDKERTADATAWSILVAGGLIAAAIAVRDSRPAS